MLQAAKSIKSVSPSTGVYFYWNSLLDWPQYYMHQIFLNNSQWWMRNISGYPMHFDGDSEFLYYKHMLGFDLSQQDCAQWWASACYNMTKTGYFDGCNADRAGKNSFPNMPNDFAIITQQYYYNRKFNTFIDIQKHLNETSGFGPMWINYGTGYKVPGVMGMTIEDFGANNYNINYLAYINYYRYNNPDNIGIKVHGGNSNPCSNHTQFINVMAAFLIAAENYTWFTCSENDYLKIGNPLWYPEYDEPLGAPTEEAYMVNRTWYREFSSGTVVMFDINDNLGTIEWGRKYDYNIENMPEYVKDIRRRKELYGKSILEVIKKMTF